MTRSLMSMAAAAAVAVATGAVTTFDTSIATKLVNGVEVSQNDDRDYLFDALPNGLKLIVVSDPKAELASAAAVVRVGSFEDYKDMPGTAHALEHLCFMGSDKFPGENDWPSWLSSHGGMSNAYTASTATNYHYQVRASSLKASLERFSRFFVAPLLSESSWGRELKNIDSEHAKNINADVWRQMQLDRSTSSPSHANNHFATGNKATLHDEPVAAGIDTRARLLAFHERHYTASRMTVAVLGQEPASTLMEWARAMFADVRDDGAPLPVYGADPYEGRTQVQFTMVPIRDMRQVTVSFTIPSQTKHYRTASSHLASHLLGHEGPGSLLSEFKRLGWATGIVAGQSSSEEDFATFLVRVDLTPLGLEHTDDIVAGIFAYTRILRKIGVEAQEWVFLEAAAVAASSFRFLGKSGPMSYATTLANNLCCYDSEHAVSGPYLARVFDPKAYATILDAFRPSKARVLITAQDKAVADLCTNKEPVYGTQYGETPVSAAQLALWGGPTGDDDVAATAKLFPGLALPEPNPFLPTDFDLRAAGETGRAMAKRLRDEAAARAATAASPSAPADEKQEEADDEAEVMRAAARGVPVLGQRLLVTPAVLRDTPQCLALWHQDAWHGEPKVAVDAIYDLPAVYQTVESSVLAGIFVHALTDDLTEIAYAAEVAGLRYSVDVDTRGIKISVFGFSHKAGELLARVTGAVIQAAAADGGISEAAVKRQLLRLRDAFRNFDKEQPYSLAMYEADVITQRPYYHVHDKLAVIEGWADAAAEGDDELGSAHVASLVRDLAGRIFRRGRVTSLIYGNVDEGGAVALLAHVTAPLAKSLPLLPGDLTLPALSRRAAVPPPGTNVRVVVPCRNPDDDNGAIQLALHLGPRSPSTSALAAVLGQMLQEPAFDQLRTKEALGYIVFAGGFSTINAVGVRVIIQSQLMPAKQLEERAEAFLLAFKDRLDSMTLESFAQYKSAVLARWKEADSSMHQTAKSVWTSIAHGTMGFEDLLDRARAVEELSLADVRAVYADAIVPGAPNRRRMGLVLTEGSAEADEGDADATAAAAVSAAASAAASAGAAGAGNTSETKEGDEDADEATDEADRLPAPNMTVLEGTQALTTLLEAAARPASTVIVPAVAGTPAGAVHSVTVLELTAAQAYGALMLLPCPSSTGMALWRLKTASAATAAASASARN